MLAVSTFPLTAPPSCAIRVSTPAQGSQMPLPRELRLSGVGSTYIEVGDKRRTRKVNAAEASPSSVSLKLQSPNCGRGIKRLSAGIYGGLVGGAVGFSGDLVQNRFG